MSETIASRLLIYSLIFALFSPFVNSVSSEPWPSSRSVGKHPSKYLDFIEQFPGITAGLLKLLMEDEELQITEMPQPQGTPDAQEKEFNRKWKPKVKREPTQAQMNVQLELHVLRNMLRSQERRPLSSDPTEAKSMNKLFGIGRRHCVSREIYEKVTLNEPCCCC
ncbi:hypothetical protein CAPTEDRAFT_226219 [Capitella teleta]|uniref:Uncharacterized protein n=1 Tax=Capitella teleta TaxID=283909 RepID=R7TGK3_CAPTE|nr:hypothetical protein CAPTEDRAFT_226219 [Capitella teleta]|eukprot:ELT92627.1 hypothetical protein CAPTEDRAFT_226219 [Capitella teleta]